jgi:hypothetical protein
VTLQYVTVSKCNITVYVTVNRFDITVYVTVSRCNITIYVTVSKCNITVYVTVSKCDITVYVTVSKCNNTVTSVTNIQRRFSVNVWCGVIDNRFFRSFVLDNNLTGNSYESFLRNEMPGLLEDIPLMVRSQMYF